MALNGDSTSTKVCPASISKKIKNFLTLKRKMKIWESFSCLSAIEVILISQWREIQRELGLCLEERMPRRSLASFLLSLNWRAFGKCFLVAKPKWKLVWCRRRLCIYAVRLFSKNGKSHAGLSFESERKSVEQKEQSCGDTWKPFLASP